MYEQILSCVKIIATEMWRKQIPNVKQNYDNCHMEIVLNCTISCKLQWVA